MNDLDKMKVLLETMEPLSELDTKTRPSPGLKDRLLNKEPAPAAHHPDDTLSDILNPKVKRREKSTMSLKDRIAQSEREPSNKSDSLQDRLKEDGGDSMDELLDELQDLAYSMTDPAMAEQLENLIAKYSDMNQPGSADFEQAYDPYDRNA